MELGKTDVDAEADADAAPGFDAGEAAAAAMAATTQPEREVHSFEIDPTQVWSTAMYAWSSQSS